MFGKKFFSEIYSMFGKKKQEAKQEEPKKEEKPIMNNPLEKFVINSDDLEIDGTYEIFLNKKREEVVYLGKTEERKGLTDVLLVASPLGRNRFHLRMFEPTYLVGKRLYLGENFPIRITPDKEDRYWHRLAEKGFLDKIS
jgi:hypothetical protein